ncbi:hypothetical protein DFH09DRAFT_1426153 [Mycena vulgaris]|nr:hypothetical protein DFH09DRAFT_1426153 [Mycena vulgaris]
MLSGGCVMESKRIDPGFRRSSSIPPLKNCLSALLALAGVALAQSSAFSAATHLGRTSPLSSSPAYGGALTEANEERGRRKVDAALEHKASAARAHGIRRGKCRHAHESVGRCAYAARGEDKASTYTSAGANLSNATKLAAASGDAVERGSPSLRIDIASDASALGALVWEMAAGKRPPINAQKRLEDWPPLSSIASRTPAFHEFIQTCFEPVNAFIRDACERPALAQLLVQCTAFEGRLRKQRRGR